MRAHILTTNDYKNDIWLLLGRCERAPAFSIASTTALLEARAIASIENTTPKKAKKSENESKTDTKELSFKLFTQGKKITEIAVERNLKESTIEGHLAHFVGTGELDISLFITDEKRKRACLFLENNEFEGLNDLREKLSNDYSYSELKMILKHWEFTQKKE